MENDVLPGILKEVQERFERDFGKSEIVRNAFATLKAKKQPTKQQMSLRLKLVKFSLRL
jgi:hypothetical protein